MANVCNNRLTVIGPEADVRAFVRDARGKDPVWARTCCDDDESWEQELRKPESELSFHALVPLPAGTFGENVPYDPIGYEAERATWGIKWGAGSVQRKSPSTPTREDYTYETAWGPAEEFIRELARRRPTLLLVVSWGSEGPKRGRYVAKADSYFGIRQDPDAENGYPERPGGFTEEGLPEDAEELLYEARLTWRNAFVQRNEHETFMLGAKAMMFGAPVGAPAVDPALLAAARAAHEANRAWCIAHGDLTQVSWDEAPDWQRASAISGVEGVLKGNGPRESHASWLAEKARTGWTFGENKDASAKTHPCMVPYDELPPEQQAKDGIFVAVVQTILAASRSVRP